jgi:outer membrane lipoprotein-sorting protein
MVYRTAIVVLILQCCGLIYAENPKCNHIQNLRNSLEENQFISLDFVQTIKSDIFEAVDTVAGSLAAGRGGLFRLESPQQIIVSNGILYWSYSAENKQVLVDSIAKIGDWDPLALLYNPENVYECISEEIRKDIVSFEMEARNEETDPRKFILSVRLPKYIPINIAYNDINNSQVITYINNFENNINISDDFFNFVIPDGVDVVEMP